MSKLHLYQCIPYAALCNAKFKIPEYYLGIKTPKDQNLLFNLWDILPAFTLHLCNPLKAKGCYSK